MTTTQQTTMAASPRRITQDDIEAAIACEVYIGGVNLADSMRFLWMTDDLDNVEDRIARANAMERLPSLNTSEARQEIDAASSIGPAIHAIGSAFETVTVCLMVLQNGTKIVGVNHGPVDPAGFSADDGRAYARQDAIRQIWPLLGYELRNRLIDEQAAPVPCTCGPNEGCTRNEGQVTQ